MMIQKPSGEKGSLSDKDLQLLKRTFLKLTELYYESPKNDSAVSDLINLATLLTQAVAAPREADALSLTSTLEILKLKSKSTPSLLVAVEATLMHLRAPTRQPLQYPSLLYALQRPELFVAGCTLAVRFFDKLPGETDWKELLGELARNISVSPSLCLELVYLACKENETVARAAVRSGIVKYVLLSHIAATLADKYHLYQSIKLLKAVSAAERTLLRDRERQLALIIYTHQDYIPLIEEICNRCYDQDYCAAIDARRKYDHTTIDQPYLWSYTEIYSTRTLSEETTTQLIHSLQEGLPEDRETKTYAILANYSKFRKVARKDVLQVLPRSPRALLNFVKLCVACGEAEAGSLAGLDLGALQGLAEKSESPKVEQLFKYLKQLRQRGTAGGVGVLSDSVRKLFSMEKNADFLMERASKIPQNTEQLADIRQILKEKDRANQFESDTLRAVKERALASLHTAVAQRRKLDLSGVLKDVELTDVRLLSRLLQTLELALTIHEDLIELVPTGRVLEIIQWIEDHYNGEMIEWSAIGQLLAILTGQQEWRKRLPQVPEKSFWLLAVTAPEGQQENELMKRLEDVRQISGKIEGKIPLMIGFLRGLTREQKLQLLKRFPEFFQLLLKNLRENNNYKTTLLMLAAFLKDWHSTSSDQNQAFEQTLVAPTVTAVLANFRSLDQQHEVLESCLPYKIPTERLADSVESLVGQHGRLASYVYRDCLQRGNKVNIGYDRIRTVGRLPPEKSRQALEILTFLQENGQLLQDDQLTPLLEGLSARKLSYWLIYPNFYNTLSRVISILSKPSGPSIVKNLSSILFKLMALLNSNPDVSEEERRDLLTELQECIKELGKRGELIQKDRLRRAIEKIAEQDIKQSLNQLIDSLPENKPQPQLQTQSPQTPKSPEQQVPEPEPSKQGEKYSQQKHNDPGNTTGLQDLQRREEPFNIDKHLQPGKQSEGVLMQALRDLKRIIEKELPEQTFVKLNQIFLSQPFREQHKDMLGYLLVKFYPNRPESLKALARDLIARKDKTYLSKESCYELLSKHRQAFVLARRWKLTGREWLDLAIERIKEGFYGIGSQIAEYNLPRSADIEYFFTKKYHEVTLSCFSKVQDADDLAYFMVLIGTSARMPEIKKAFVKQKLHIRVLQAYTRFSDNLKLIGNLSYALSALAYVQPDVCLQVGRQKQELSLLLQKYSTHWDNRPIVQSGACLLANLAYSNEQVKQMLRQLGCSGVLLSILEKLLDRPEVTTFKQVLRALGNLSLSSKCAQEIIDCRFCTLAVLMMERLDIFVQMDDKKAALMKILIDLIANLASHRYRLEIFHKEKLTLAILTMLETTQDHPPILTACIDTIDCLCQNPEIENYVVTEKRILYLLVDVLKVQTDEKIVVKSTRLLTNLTINPACIPYILEANLLSVLASIVMPHFYGNKLATEQRKKMETYILKIVTRIYHSKQSRELILRSGYLDCLLRTIQTSDIIEDAYIEILYSYSDSLPNFLNKRAFLCLLRIIARKIANRQAVARSFRIVKTLSNLYERDEEDVLLPQAPEMYEKLLASNEFREEGLFLLAYHLLRSYKLRQTLQKKNDELLEIVKQLSEDSKLADLCREVFFIAFNPFSALREWEGNELGLSMEQAYQALRGGFKCSLFRMDGSSKKAVVDINQEYQLRAYKFPGGQIKKKYVINIKNLKDFQFNYPVSEELWGNTVFSVGGGLFDSHKSVPQNCCSLIGSGKWGELSFINVEFENEEEKNKFYRSISLVFHSVR